MIKTPLSAVIGGAFWTPSATILGSTSKTFNQLIKSIFANGEQGFAYDPNDLSTMFRDAAGTVPVTAVGQPVGLMLDKSKGLAVGEELFNQTVDFSTWIKTAAVTSASGNTFTTNGLGGCIKNPVVVGMSPAKSYQVRIVGTCTVAHKIRSSFSATGEVSVPAGAFDVTIKSPVTFSGGTMYFQLQSAGTMTVNSISIKELAGNHAYQTNAASRPLLQRNATTGAYYLAFDGGDDFLVTNSINFTSTDKVSLFAGVRKLSDVNSAIVIEHGVAGVNNKAFTMSAPDGNKLSNYSASLRNTSRATVFLDNKASPRSSVLSVKLNYTGATIADQVKMIENATPTPPSTDGSLLTATNFNDAPIYIGRRGGTSLPFNGHIYGLIGIGKLTSDNETTVIEKELAKRVGVTLNV